MVAALLARGLAASESHLTRSSSRSAVAVAFTTPAPSRKDVVGQ